MNRWTINNFQVGPFGYGAVELLPNEALLETEDMGVLSGYGRVDKFRNNNGMIIYVSNIQFWRS